MKSFKAGFNILIILAIFLVITIVINPFGDFPLNDDWSYGKITFRLFEEKKLEYDQWCATFLIPQSLWGILFITLLGKSFVSLRISTIVMSFFGTVAFYYILYLLTQNKNKSLLGTLVYLFNPIYLNLTFTYMTDIHFVSLTNISLVFFIAFFKKKKRIYYLIALIFALLAAFVRQYGVVLLILPLLYYFFKSKFLQRVYQRKFLTADFLFTAATGFCVLIFALFALWFYTLPYTNKHTLTFNPFVIAYMAVSSIIYISLSVLPLAFLHIREMLKTILKNKLVFLLIFLSFCVSLITASLLKNKIYIMPLLWNVFFNLGLGPATLKDTFILGDFYILGYPYIFSMHISFWIILTIILIILATVMLIRATQQVKRWIANKNKMNKIPESYLIYTYACILILCYGVSSNIWDRYTIALNSAAILFFLQSFKRKFDWKGIALYTISLLIIVAFSVAATQTYLAWNDARWRNTDYLMSELDISPNQIDGGFEFNGLHGFYEDPEVLEKWVPYDEYVVAFNVIEGYDVIHSEKYFSLMDLNYHYIYALKKQLVLNKFP